MSRVQTDNSYFSEKVEFRLRFLKKNRSYKILDAYGGNGTIWKSIKLQTPTNFIDILSLDIKVTSKADLIGDNVKYLGGLDLKKFDIIDLDAYGVPYMQLREIFRKKIKGIEIFITFIQSVYGKLPYGMLEELGFKRSMFSKCSTLFNRNGIEKLKHYLAKHGIKKMSYICLNNKYYIHIKT